MARAGLLTQIAGELKRKDGITWALAWYETLEKRGLSGQLAISMDYDRANAIATERHGTPWAWEQSTLAREIFYLRRAISNPSFDLSPASLRCMCLNNLGSRLRVTGRVIESLDCWRRAIEINPNFGMSLWNRARLLADYAGGLEDPNESALFYGIYILDSLSHFRRSIGLSVEDI